MMSSNNQRVHVDGRAVILLWISVGHDSVMVRPCSLHVVLTELVRPRVLKAGVTVRLHFTARGYISLFNAPTAHTLIKVCTPKRHDH